MDFLNLAPPRGVLNPLPFSLEADINPRVQGTITFLLLGLGGVQAAASSNAAALAAASNQSANGGSNSINKVASIEVGVLPELLLAAPAELNNKNIPSFDD